MSKKPNPPDPLRAEAEAQLARAPAADMSSRPAEELLHELRVHQIELEMQNEALRQAQITLEESRDRYVDLYDFSPVGYLTLTRTGMCAEINLTGAALLGVERKKLLRRRFAHFVVPEDSERWHRYFMRAVQHGERQGCELALKRGDGSIFYAHLDCLRAGVGNEFSVRIALADITGRKRAEQHLRALSAHLNTVREEEKASIAREIHDELGGTLTALKMEAYQLARELQRDKTDKETKPPFNRIELMSQLLDNAVNVTRNIIADLRPTVLDDLGLLAALEWQAAQFHKRTGVECRVNCVEDRGDMDKRQSIALFRIFQETLTNVARHSGATRVEAKYHHGDGEAFLSVSDNGSGMPEGYSVASNHYGMLGMIERVEQLCGEIEFDSPAGGGFRVVVVLPLPAAN